MLLRFLLKYGTRYGQSLHAHLRLIKKGQSDILIVLDLTYLNEAFWEATYELPTAFNITEIKYRYTLQENDAVVAFDQRQERTIVLPKNQKQTIQLFDDWQHVHLAAAVHKSRAYKILLPEKTGKPAKTTPDALFHFRVQTQPLPPGNSLCMLGSGAWLGDWDSTAPVMLHWNGHEWTGQLSLPASITQLDYKMGIYNFEQQKVIALESGDNRSQELTPEKNVRYQWNQFVDFGAFAWKGTGVNVQLSSLRTAKSWGVGDFSDLHILTDWCAEAGIRMIQLLPINDTTATFTQKDSYPYSAVSAFAQHPIFLDVQTVAKKYKCKIPTSLTKERAILEQATTLEYERVMRLKETLMRMVFSQQKEQFQKEGAFIDFFNDHKHWLVPYAVFCVLRDRHQSADCSSWEIGSEYADEQVAQWIQPEGLLYEEVCYYYFIQYHLHLQLSKAVSHAHKKGIIIKGDLPIGVGRHSVETWMYPNLFHMDKQAGAPPDAFTRKGQNWSFPTYNWDAMQLDGYAWWRQRLQHMSHYFDATRIDHVLGFFRIWSIPLSSIEGITGVFEPTHPISEETFRQSGIAFNHHRLCDPYITDGVLQDLFGTDATVIREHFLDGNRFKETCNTQRAMDAYITAHPQLQVFRQRLFDLITDLILIPDTQQPGAYHFRIDMQHTVSFRNLPADQQQALDRLYVDYFYHRPNDLWYKTAQSKLDAIQQSSDMMICAEDLGMVPDMVEGVLDGRQMLSLQVQRMPKRASQAFSLPAEAPYLTVVTPSTHDMSTIRQWWEDDAGTTSQFFRDILHQSGNPPFYGEPWICRDIIRQHLESPAMWAVFLLQDFLSMDASLRRENPHEERINNPADPDHYWNYRVHLSLESLMTAKAFNQDLVQLIHDAGRC